MCDLSSTGQKETSKQTFVVSSFAPPPQYNYQMATPLIYEYKLQHIMSLVTLTIVSDLMTQLIQCFV